VNLEALLGEPATKREKWLQDKRDRKLTDTVKKATVGAATLEDLHAALLPVIDAAATPDFVPNGAMVLQPSEERRRSGSHYTPRALTEPIVRTTLEPILARLRGVDGQAGAARADPRPQGLRPGHGLGRVPSRGLPPARRRAQSRPGTLTASVPAIPPDEDEVIFARSLIAQRCLYGVDRNPVAVDLAKVSLWLATLAKDQALTFVDHALRHGDSLVGLSRKQIEAFHWEGDAPAFQAGLETMRVREHAAKVAALRQRIREADERVSDWELRALWDEAQFELGKVRLLGDLVLAAYFDGDKPKEREGKRGQYASAVVSGEAERYRGWLEELRHADQPLAPFHWEIEFPEVFEREHPGFDGTIGNPPFMGGKKISTNLGYAYANWLADQFASNSRNADLVAYFFCRAFGSTRLGGSLGLIATNTIRQGDTRRTGLRSICESGGSIYAARTRVPWPGLAAVVVSVIHIIRGAAEKRVLDGRAVPTITAYLFHAGGHQDPATLAQNANQSFIGHFLHGMGFTFDDDKDGATASSLTDMRRILEQDPFCAERLFPFVGGSDLNDPAEFKARRFAICFGLLPLTDAMKWPALLAVVEAKVRPEREKVNRKSHRERWWQYGDYRSGLVEACSGLERVLACALHSHHLSLGFLPARAIFSHGIAVFPFEAYAAFCGLQSRPHEVWARFFSSSLGDALRYTPSDCLETFPFPCNWQTDSALEAAGKAYYESRAALMSINGEGLTKTYNRFHDPNERDPGMLRLRALHNAMDRAVLDAYGWSDIPTDCKFLLDYEVEGEDDEWGDGKRPYRYRWPDEVRDEVLARLLELNTQRAKEEALTGARSTKAKKMSKPTSRALPASTEQMSLGGEFDD
jgi:hypothetical protein